MKLKEMSPVSGFLVACMTDLVINKLLTLKSQAAFNCSLKSGGLCCIRSTCCGLTV